MAQTCLPPGFRFHPTDVELVSYYLKRKIMGKKLIVQAISEVELYKFAPWDLPDKSCLRSKDLEWFFFCPRDKKYPNGSRTNRATPNGYWKTSGKDRIIELNSRLVGSKKTLIFHEGKAPKGNRTDWVMYEYKMEDDQLVSAGFSKDAYVLCKIFKKSGLGPRIGEQYGAPFNENEWDIPDADTSMFPLMPSSEVVNSTGATHVQPAVTLGAIEEPHPHVHHLSVASAEIEISENTTAATVDDLGYVTAECAPQELPSQQPVDSTQDGGLISVNDGSIEATIAYSPLIDGILLDELSMFLNDSPRHGTPVGEYSGLPPMSEAEAHAFDVNNYDLYNEIAGLAELGVPGGDDFCATNVCGPESTFQPTSCVFNSSDDPNYLDMDELFDPAPSANLYQLPVPDNQLLQYPWDQSTYYGDYHDSSALSAASASSDSLPTMPNVVDDFPAVANKDGLARDPSLQYPFP